MAMEKGDCLKGALKHIAIILCVGCFTAQMCYLVIKFDKGSVRVAMWSRISAHITYICCNGLLKLYKNISCNITKSRMHKQ